jgi:Cytidylate kinase-like family
MKCSVERLIEALIGAEMARERKVAEARAAENKRSTYVVTVSRGYGALGKEIAQALADVLGVRCCDRTILQEVAKRANVDVELIRRLDERAGNIGSDWWQSLFKGQSYPKERYLHHLVKVILNISMKGGVIVGRGAHLILGPHRCFRVRIVGSPERCAERISVREAMDIEAAKKRVEQVDRERAEYINELYGVHAGDSSNFDLVINSDRFTVSESVSLILDAMQQAGYELTPEVLRSAVL